MGVEIQLYVVGDVGGDCQYVFYCVVEFCVQYVVIGIGVEVWCVQYVGYFVGKWFIIGMYGDCVGQVGGDFFGE